MDSTDIILWPDYSWCYREELAECHWKSDDYIVIKAGTPAWQEFIDHNESTE